MSESQYLSCAETAKLVRKVLKTAFQGVKFSVRSDTYSGGASIDIRWTDGPNPRSRRIDRAALRRSHLRRDDGPQGVS
jgi:hypothetical protein